MAGLPAMRHRERLHDRPIRLGFRDRHGAAMLVGATVMRFLLPALVFLIACSAIAHTDMLIVTAAAKPAKPVKSTEPKPAPVSAAAKGAYAAMPDAERYAIQSDLIWTGDYNGVVGAEIGDRAIAAVQAFQKRNGGRETGVLNPDERARLAQSAKARQEQSGWHIVDDAATGAWLGIPEKIVPQSSRGKAGSHWQSGHGEVQVDTFRIAEPGTTLAGVFEQQKKEPERKIEYNVLRPDFFVLSGLQRLKKLYVRAQVKDNEVRGITILYDQAMEGTLDRIAVAMSSAFVAFPSQTASAGAAPRRKVEYGTGLVVSAAGDIVTDADLLVGCDVVVVSGFGHAERLAEDKGSALALLRVNGARDLAPTALAAAGVSGGDITLVGIADPQAQNGGNAVSTARGRVATADGTPAAIKPAPAAGFAGAAALDRDGRLAGIVGFRPAPTTAAGSGAQAAIVPAQAVAKFLGAQQVVPPAGRADIESVKAATVRIICVRK
jgi:hypothetical protein